MSPVELAILAAYYGALGVLAVYGAHRFYLVRLRRRHRPAVPPPVPLQWPSVTVQLPVFNEPNVIARLIDAAARLEYPGALDLQVLDDSDDETSAIAAARIASWQERGVLITHIRRTSRDGFKAGALAHGMSLSSAELFAIFDADFVPTREFLLRTVPHFSEPSVGMVQVRWDHLNRESSLLTRVQAVFLDAHFSIESATRSDSGRFFNFNGTAGIWRRRAIEDAGGWSSSTLTEDLDLSYRSQLAGWSFVFRNDLTVPAELPEALNGFQEQQHRWAKGSAQTARKLLGRILRSALPLRVKAESLFHLTGNLAYVAGVAVAILLPLSMWIRREPGLTALLALDAALFAASTASILLFYVEGQRRASRGRIAVRDLLAVLPIGVGIAVRNSAAVLSGLITRGGHFTRTPKRGATLRDPYEKRPRLPVAELVLACYYVVAIIALAGVRHWLALPFLLLFVSGYSWAAIHGLSERLSSITTDTSVAISLASPLH